MPYFSACLLLVGLAGVCFGATRAAEPASPDGAGVAERSSVSQYGITWTFDKPAKTGRFATGDWWVLGPVTVASIQPAPGPLAAEAKVEIKKGVWGDTSLKNDMRMRNGSMIVLQCGGKHGYDSRSSTYDPELSVKLPCALEPNRSLISTISNSAFPVQNFPHKIMWSKEKNAQVALKAAAVLTCLAEEPPADAFRPPYGGTEKPLYRAADLKWDLLLKLQPAGEVPSWEDFEGYFRRPWLDHLTNWTQQELNPNENQPCYGREHARLVSMASLMLQLDAPQERKEKLLIGLVQYGIDLSGLAKAGGVWNMGGGHSSGRKWPVLFASLMLDAPKLRELPESAVFHEDAQTYYGEGWFGQTALWQMITHHGPRQPYEEKPPEQWEKWDKTSEGYRCCCNAVAWAGTALAARQMKAIGIWKHDAFFDYCDRWMREDDPYAEKRGQHKRPDGETKTFDPFVDAMWKAYRKEAPEQEFSGVNKKWVWQDGAGSWVDNPRPAETP
ncbi:MAG: hypothetical protein M5U26_12455 [Planctomycetota bacterium]|nr:hypothetical protein [Planctomycetota bacterium]